MKKGRLEAFSDGVLAIIITIMVLEFKVPEGSQWKDLYTLLPKFLSYILSFTMILIYWNNHHNLFQTIEKINGKVLLANGLLLFFLSLLPFATAWMGENHFQREPVILMGFILAMCGISYYILLLFLKGTHEKDSKIHKALGRDFKGKFSVIIYIFAMFLAFVHPYISLFLYVFVAFMWFYPDKRMEKVLDEF